jgi:hypothetical protein
MKNLLRTTLLLMALLISVTAIAQTSSSAADQAAKTTKTTKNKRKAAKNTKTVAATPSADKPASAMTPAEVEAAAKNAAAAPAVAPTAPAVVRMDDATAPAGVSITPNPAAIEPAAAPAPLTTIKFEEVEFDFGQIKQGETVKHKFKFTNTGTNPLILENVKPSCGCTAIDWPKEPIAPGQTGEIEAQFNSTGKFGDQLKNITITLNTTEHLERLTFKGFVVAPPTETPAPAHSPGDGHQH